MEIVFTIGHSTHSQDEFIALLKKHEINALCDVRSMPFSAWSRHFNKPDLELSLQRMGLQYRFLGKELGARSDDPSCYSDGKIQYDLLAQTKLFRVGLNRILSGARQGLRIALMCAEKDPIECHRAILIARRLKAMGVEIEHIRANGDIETHEFIERRLVKMFFPQDDLFLSPEQMLEHAYTIQGDRIAYAISDEIDQKRAVG